MLRRTRVGWIGRLAALALAGLLLLAACGGDGQADAEAGLRISLIPAAGGIAGESLTVELADREGNPITDATVSLEGNMNHAGMVPVFSADVRDEADGAADGRYAIPFQFTMLGDWIVTVAVQLADGTAIRQDVDVTVTGGEVRVR